MTGTDAELRGARVLVTGAGGFIGSHLAERLVELGARVRAFVHYNALGSRGWLEQSPHRDEMEIVLGDVADRDSVDAAVRDCEVVFHLAALIAIPFSYRAPGMYVATNVTGTMNLLQASRMHGVRRVVHTSTSEVYGTAQYVPIDEAHPLVGQSPYSATKIGADKIAEAFQRSFDVPVVTVRPFNTFGPRQSARAVIPTIIGQALAGRPIELGHVHPTRDFNYVTNTVDGFVRAATVPGAIGETINLGTGVEVSIGELVERVSALLGVPLSTTFAEQRARPPASEVERLLADASKARSLLDWSPAVDLHRGLELTIDWMREHLARYRTHEYVV